jgi:menaquinone-dependent protoporphyrinogen oxidase
MKALVAYGTRYGSTTGIAEKIRSVLERNDIEVDLVNLGKERVTGLEEYEFIVIGSGIQVGNWTKESLRFLEKNAVEINQKKHALFVTSGLARDKSKQEEYTEQYLNQVAEKYGLNPISVGLFVGSFDMNKYNFPVKLLMKVMTKDLEEEGYDLKKPVDLREWDLIEDWALGLVERIR